MNMQSPIEAGTDDRPAPGFSRAGRWRRGAMVLTPLLLAAAGYQFFDREAPAVAAPPIPTEAAPAFVPPRYAPAQAERPAPVPPAFIPPAFAPASATPTGPA